MLEILTILTFIAGFFFILMLIFIAKRTYSVNAFIFVIVCFLAWDVANYVSRVAENDLTVLWSVRAVMFITALLFIGIIEFMNFFPNNTSYFGQKTRFTYLGLYSILTFLTITPLIIDNVTVDADQQTLPVFGSLSILYFLGLIISILIFSYLTVAKYRKGNDLTKQQIKSIAFGILITGVLGAVTNVVFVLLKSASLVILGPSFALILLASVTYSITRYRLFDIRILIGKITYFLLLSLIVIVFYYFAYYIDRSFFDDSLNWGALLFGVPVSITFIIVFNSANKFIMEKVDSTLVNPGFDPKEVVSSFNNQVSTMLDFTEISQQTIAFLSKTLRTSFETVLIIDAFQIKETILGKKEMNLDLVKLVDTLKIVWTEKSFPIIINNYGIDIPVQLEGKIDMKLFDWIKQTDLRIIYPLIQNDQIIGVVLLGEKEGDSPFNSTEIDFINSIVDLTALSLARSFLYKEVQEFNSTLQRKIDDATLVIQEKNKKLEETLHFERDMLDILGHELRTPLGTARNAILLLKMQKEKGALSDELLDKEIKTAAENIKREVQLLESILASTKIDNNKLELNFEQVDLVDVVNDSVEGNTPDAEKKGLKLYSENLPKDPVFGLADRLRIQQVIDNLVSNAVKYTATGEIKISLKEDGDFYKVSVADTGEGIPQEDISKLGQKFYRINTYLESPGKLGDRKIIRPGGTGIGLYVSFQLVKAMNGKVDVQSELGKGSVFSFSVPKYKGE